MKILDDLVEITYEDHFFDIINEVNRVLYTAETKLQFVANEEDQDDDSHSVFYALEKREDLVQE